MNPFIRAMLQAVDHKKYKFVLGDAVFVVPSGVTSIIIHAIGGGGGGASGRFFPASGGGAGGSGKGTYTVVPGETLTLTVGDGGAHGGVYNNSYWADPLPGGDTTVVGSISGLLITAGGGGVNENGPSPAGTVTGADFVYYSGIGSEGRTGAGVGANGVGGGGGASGNETGGTAVNTDRDGEQFGRDNGVGVASGLPIGYDPRVRTGDGGRGGEFTDSGENGERPGGGGGGGSTHSVNLIGPPGGDGGKGVIVLDWDTL